MNGSVNGEAPEMCDQLARQRGPPLLSICCALSVLTLVVMVPPLNKLVRDLLIKGPMFIEVAVVCLVASALIGSLYFYFAVLLHLIRCRDMGATGKTLWGVFLFFGGTLTRSEEHTS